MLGSLMPTTQGSHLLDDRSIIFCKFIFSLIIRITWLLLARIWLKISDVVIDFWNEGVFYVFSLRISAVSHQLIVNRYLLVFFLFLLMVSCVVFRFCHSQLFLHLVPPPGLLLYSLPTRRIVLIARKWHCFLLIFQLSITSLLISLPFFVLNLFFRVHLFAFLIVEFASWVLLNCFPNFSLNFLFSNRGTTLSGPWLRMMSHSRVSF
jgi:hypothetical protein